MLNKPITPKRLIFRLLLLLLLLLSSLFVFAPRSLAAQTEPPPLPDEYLAGLVVDFGKGQIETRCVAFTEESISGYQLLERSGLAFGMDASSGIGAAICQIEEMGCPGTDCFCQCKGGGACAYWTYWQLNENENEGAWTYAQAGASMVRVSEGMVHGWRWGDKSELEAMPPLSTDFAQVCAAELADRENTAVLPISNQNQSPSSITDTTASFPAWLAYLAFGLILSVLGVGLVLIRRK